MSLLNPGSGPVAWLVLDRYLAGECTAEEALRVRVLLETSSVARAELTALLDALGAAGEEPDRAAMRASFERLRASRSELREGDFWPVGSGDEELRHEALDVAMPAGGRAGRWPRADGRGWGVGMRARHAWRWLPAALVTLVVGAGVVSLARRASPWRSGHGSGTPVQQYATATGQRAVVTLRDGTRVTLAPRTTLRVAAFGVRARAVTLEGEAYFEVVRAAGAPFVVRSGAAQARVLGTAFAVRHYPAESDARVAVTAGRVVVTPAGRPEAAVVLTAGAVGVVTDTTATSDGDAARYTEWVRGRLVFRGAPLGDVLATLSRWYGYEFRLADSTLLSGRLTASLSTESSAEALATLKLFLGVDLAFDGNVITLTPRHAEPLRAAPRGRYDTLLTSTREIGR